LTSLIACLLLIGLGSAIWQVRQAQTLVGQERAINLFLSQLIYAGDERVLTSTARDLRSTLTAALAHIEGQSLGASADARVLTLLARGLLAQDAYAAAARALALAEQRVSVAPDADYAAEHAMLQAQLALAALEAAAQWRARAGRPYDPDELGCWTHGCACVKRTILRPCHRSIDRHPHDSLWSARAHADGSNCGSKACAQRRRSAGHRIRRSAVERSEARCPPYQGLTSAAAGLRAYRLYDEKGATLRIDIAIAQLQQSLLLALPSASLICIDVRTGLPRCCGSAAM
jgi:hypothetical protein